MSSRALALALLGAAAFGALVLGGATVLMAFAVGPMIPETAPATVSAPAPVARGEARSARLRLGLSIRGAERTRDLRLVRLVPSDLPGRLRVRSLTVEPEPSEWLETDGARYAVWRFAQPAETTRLSIEAEVEILPLDLALARADADRRQGVSAESLDRWRESEPTMESDDPGFVELAASTPEGEPWERALALLNATLDGLAYDGYLDESAGAVGAWARGTGDCTDYTDVFVALCRAARLPARHVVGYTVEWDDVPRHSWAEVHLGELGWVPFDPLHVELGKASFDRLQPVYVPLSFVREDARLDGHWYWAYTHAGASPVVEEWFEVEDLAPVIR